jgi:lysophospholipase L1-like esterase
VLFEHGQKVLFIGDSITDAGRREVNLPWGLGYMSQARDLIVARYPALQLSFVNRGIGGDTTRKLLARWQTDVLAEQPDWLVLKIGINDVWRSFTGDPAEAVSLAEYRANLRRLLDQTRAQTPARLILLTPYMIEADRTHPMRAAMDSYGDAVRTLAPEYGAILVDTQAAFDSALQTTTPAHWAEDQIHPNGPGNAVIALALLAAVGFTVAPL